ICGHVLHREILSGCFNESLKERTITSETIRNLNSSDDVCFNTTHQMHFDPIAFAHKAFAAVLRVNPFIKAASREAGRVNRKVGFDSLKGQTACFYKRLEQRRERWVFQVAGNRIVVSGTL